MWTDAKCKCSPVKALDGLSDHRAIAAMYAQELKPEESQLKYIEKRNWEEAPAEDMVRIVKEEISHMKGRTRQQKKMRKAFGPKQAEDT